MTPCLLFCHTEPDDSKLRICSHFGVMLASMLIEEAKTFCQSCPLASESPYLQFYLYILYDDVVVVLLFNVRSKQLWSWRDDQST